VRPHRSPGGRLPGNDRGLEMLSNRETARTPGDGPDRDSTTGTMTGLRIDVADLLSKPSARRVCELEAEIVDLVGSSARVEGALRLAVTLERIPEGILARGAVDGAWTAQCSEGLEDLQERFRIAFDELFEAHPIEGETYPIGGDEIDLEQLVRDTVLLELPLAPVCAGGHPDVAAALGSEPEVPDPRWAALSRLELKE